MAKVLLVLGFITAGIMVLVARDRGMLNDTVGSLITLALVLAATGIGVASKIKAGSTGR